MNGLLARIRAAFSPAPAPVEREALEAMYPDEEPEPEFADADDYRDDAWCHDSDMGARS